MSARSALLLLTLTAAMPAAEIVRRDLQFSVGSAATDFDYTIASPGGGFSGSDAFDTGWQTRLGARWAIISPGWSLAPVLGGDLLYTSRAGGGGGLDGYGLGVTAGVAWAVTERWSADLELALCYERAALSLDGASALSGSGDLFDTDLRLRILRQLDRRWSLGVELGLQRVTGSIAANEQRDVDLDLSGWTAGVLVSWRVSMRPADLE